MTPDPALSRLRRYLASVSHATARPAGRLVLLAAIRQLTATLIRIAASIACVAYLCAAAGAGNIEDPMHFTLQEECEGSGCTSYILAQGKIVSTTPDAFRIFASRIKFRPTVYFDSPGGDLAAALVLGLAIRKAQLDTFVGGPYRKVVGGGRPYAILVHEGICFSACAYAFLGGVTREVGEKGKLGVHQFRGARGDSGEASAQVTVATLSTYVDQMGGDRRILDLAALAKPNQLQLLSRDDARHFNLDNTEPPKAAWRLEADSTGRLFLIVSQRQARRDGTLSLMIFRGASAFRAVLLYQFRQEFRSGAELEQMFSGRTTFFARTSKASYQLTPLSEWGQTRSGFRISLSLPEEAMAAMSSAAAFELDADWPNAMRDIKPSGAFGTVGLRNGTAAMSRQ